MLLLSVQGQCQESCHRAIPQSWMWQSCFPIWSPIALPWWMRPKSGSTSCSQAVSVILRIIWDGKGLGLGATMAEINLTIRGFLLRRWWGTKTGWNGNDHWIASYLLILIWELLWVSRQAEFFQDVSWVPSKILWEFLQKYFLRFNLSGFFLGIVIYFLAILQRISSSIFCLIPEIHT